MAIEKCGLLGGPRSIYMNCFAYPVIHPSVCSANLCKWHNFAGVVTVSYRTKVTWSI